MQERPSGDRAPADAWISSFGANTNVKEAGCRRPDRQIGAVQEMEEPGRLAWWPSAVAVQAEAANHPELLRSRAVVVSVVGKVAP
jgi:hypothetical protein